jgi:hypothetical protein
VAPSASVSARRYTRALAVVNRLQDEATPLGASREFSEVARLCRLVERDVGRDAGIIEKLGSLLQQASRYELPERMSSEDAVRAKLIYLADCSSIRAIIERLSAQ